MILVLAVPTMLVVTLMPMVPARREVGRSGAAVARRVPMALRSMPVPPGIMAITRRGVVVLRAGSNDLQADPGEVHNRWTDPELAHIQQELIQVLCNWRIRSGLHTADFAAEYR